MGTLECPAKVQNMEVKKGVQGCVPIGNLESHMADMMVSLAGSIFLGMVEPNNKIAIISEQKDYEERLSEYANENGISVEMAEDKFG